MPRKWCDGLHAFPYVRGRFGHCALSSTAREPGFLLRVLQVAFGYAAVVNTSKKAYPWPLIVLCHLHLASFTKAH